MKKQLLRAISTLLTTMLLFSSFSIISFNASDNKILYGDADKNGIVSIEDVTIIQKYLANGVSADKLDLTAASVVQKDELSISDATYIQKYLAKKIDKFPIENQPNTVKVTFNVTIPEVIPDGASISIGTNFNDWNPADTSWFMTKIDDHHYQLVKDIESQYVGKNLLYKYTVQVDGQDNMWAQVEGGVTGGEIDNRTFTITAQENTTNDTVSMFKNQTNLSSVTGGTIETFKLDMPQYSDGRTRNIRVWIPDGYDPSNTDKKYPVFYMQDGQNLFDSYTSFSGEWMVDEAITDMSSQGYEGAIIVGIDNSSDRINEYTPNWTNPDSETADNPSGDKYIAFIAETLKPYIDSHYNVRTDIDSTGIGGSSMGGLISYYAGLQYPNIFGQVLVFSPSFWLFSEDTVKSEIASKDFSNSESLPKFYLYAGGEPSISPYIGIVKDEMLKNGYPEEKINTLIDSTQSHNEKAWSKYFPEAYKWLVGFNVAPPAEKDFYRIYLDTTFSKWETPYIAMWIGQTNIVAMTPVTGKSNLFYYDLPKEQTEFLFRANDDLTQWGAASSANVTFRPANENMVYVLNQQLENEKYAGAWQALPEQDTYTVYFDVSASDWTEAYICMWIGGENFVKMTPVENKTGIYSFKLPKGQTEFLLRADLDFSNWGKYASTNIIFSPENENMVYVFSNSSGDGKHTGSWQAYTE